MGKGWKLILGILICGSRLGLGIINGEPVASDHPIAKSTVSLSGPLFKSFGTGVLIDRRHVLTVLHNLFWPRLIKVRFGPEGTRPEFERTVVSFNLFQKAPFQYADIALLTLDKETPPGYLPVELLSPDSKLAEGVPLIVSGFGVGKEFAVGTEGTLRYARAIFREYLNQGKEFRTDPIIRKVGPSFGDSGGPAFLANGKGKPLVSRSGRLILIGLIERGLNLQFDGRAVCLHTAAYKTWLLKHSEARFSSGW
jgi:hypothetical protein